MNFEITKSKIIIFYLSVIIFAFSTSPSFAINSSSMNLLLITIMAISPLILVISIRNITKEDIFLILFFLSIIFSPLLNNPETMRWSTVMYSFMFGITFLVYKHLLYKNVLEFEYFIKILKYLIYAYTIVLIIQQACVLLGLPIFNIHAYDPTTPWKLNSLSSEPSHSARFVGLLMFCYIISKEIFMDKKYSLSSNFKEDKYIWLSFFWTMLTMGSGTSLLFVILVLSIFLRLRTLIVFIMFLIILYGLIDYLDIKAADRTIKLFLATLTLDPETMMEADRSGSSRIVPFIVLIERVDFTTINGWFGHGIDYVGNNLYMYFAIPIKGYSGGGMLALWMEYGFLSFILFLIFSLMTTINRKNLKILFFWFFLIFMYGVNSQFVWATITIMFTIKYFDQQKEFTDNLKLEN